MESATITSFSFTKQQVDTLRSLLASNGNRIAAVWWQVEQWWPKAHTDVLIDFVEMIRDGNYDDWAKAASSSDYLTITPI